MCPGALGQTTPKGFLTRFLRADILVHVGCWSDTYRPAIPDGYYNRSGCTFISITKDWTPRILQSADVNAATELCSVTASSLDGLVHRKVSSYDFSISFFVWINAIRRDP
jgi:hypothetical protein